MPTQLTDIDVHFISLVKKGANGKTVIFKSADADMDAPELRQFRISKLDDEKQMVYGIVYSPGEVDIQGDFAKADDIEHAAHNFLKQLRVHQVDEQHDYNPDDGYVAESWLTKAGGDPYFADEPTGSWAVGIKVENDETWALVKSGEYEGLSMAGNATRTEVEKQDALRKQSWIFKTAWDAVRKGIEKDFNSEYRWDLVWDAMDALWYSIWDVLNDSTIPGADKETQIQTNVDQFLAALRSETQILKSEDTEMDKETLEKTIDERLTATLKPLTEQIDALQKSLETQKEDPEDEPVVEKTEGTDVEAEIADLKAKIADLEKSTNGSARKKGQDDVEKETKNDGIKFF